MRHASCELRRWVRPCKSEGSIPQTEQRLRCSFPTQMRPSYYYEKRSPILHISQYYIYRTNFRQRGCNLDARNVIATSHAAHRSGRTRWSPRRSHFIDPTSLISMTNTSSQRSEARLQCAEFLRTNDSAVALRNRKCRRAP